MKLIAKEALDFKFLLVFYSGNVKGSINNSVPLWDILLHRIVRKILQPYYGVSTSNMEDDKDLMI